MTNGRSTIKYLKALNIDCALIELETPFGHYGPMVDIDEWSNELHSFIENNSLQDK